MSEINEKIKYYMSLPYTKEIFHDEDDPDTFYIRVKELSGCISDGDTEEEALKNIKEAMEGWIETAIENNIEIPLPNLRSTEGYSGTITLRVPKSLHKELAEAAKEEDVSMNNLAQTYITKGLGAKQATVVKKNV